MPGTIINISHNGRMANKMFQYMFASFLQQQIPGSIITGLDIPTLGLKSTTQVEIPAAAVTLKGHNPRVDKIIYAANHGLIDFINLSGYFINLMYYNDPRSCYKLFSDVLPDVGGYDDNHLVINIRADEILSDLHKGYFPLPNAYYKHLIESTGLKPVFMGQVFGTTKYHESLRGSFPDAIYHRTKGPSEDFSTIVNSKNIAISISSFSWLAAWLSNANRIFMPIGGIFDPTKRSDVHLMPPSDPRYKFYSMANHAWDSNSMSHVALNEQADTFSPMSRDEINTLVRTAFLGAVGA